MKKFIKLKDDVKYIQEFVILKLLNKIMLSGKKFQAEQILKKALNLLKKNNKKKKGDPYFLLFNAIEKIKPLIILRDFKIKRKVNKIPTPIHLSKQYSYAIKFLIEATKKRKEFTLAEKLSGELKDILRKRGESYKKVISIYKTGSENRMLLKRKKIKKRSRAELNRFK